MRDKHIAVAGAGHRCHWHCGRWMSVAGPVLVLRRWLPFERHAIALLTWGGLRGGLSVAMALPAAMHRHAFVTITYVIVVFSIIVQGLTIGRLGKWVGAER